MAWPRLHPAPSPADLRDAVTKLYLALGVPFVRRTAAAAAAEDAARP